MNQAVIVGAGPTGATLALLLAKRGIPPVTSKEYFAVKD
jgi:2-polyprenyl-6-methoxyphenol hydroxylase-like FAD-dependent oxidoreductase